MQCCVRFVQTGT